MEGGGPTRSSGRAALRQGMERFLASMKQRAREASWHGKVRTTRFIMLPICSSDSILRLSEVVARAATGYSQRLPRPCHRVELSSGDAREQPTPNPLLFCRTRSVVLGPSLIRCRSSAP